jgi:serine O-acetyltransferase
MTIVELTPVMMRWSLGADDLVAYTANQLHMFSADKRSDQIRRLSPHMKETINRVERCFQNIRRKYFFDGENTLFNHLHGDHYAMYLYYLSNTVYRSGRDEELAQYLFLLNKALHGIDLFYAVSMPEVFLLIHPVGTVLGNATYGNYFVAYQNCGIGSLEDGRYPVFEGENVLFARTSVLGNCHVGRNVVFGANAFVLDSDIPSDCTVVGSYPNHRTLSLSKSVIERMFR